MCMRVISQDGMIDVPYEMTAFHICNGYIHMNMAGNTGRGTAMAAYSTQEKAQAAMNKLREAYAGVAIFQNIKMEDYEKSPQLFKKSGLTLSIPDEPLKFEWHGNGVFQFPADDEVEP